MIPSKPREIPFWLGIIPILTLIALLSWAVYHYGADATSGPSQIILIFTGTFAALLAFLFDRKITWLKLEASILHHLRDVLQAILILLLIGALIGLWIYAGIVPAIVYWGLMFMHPSIFLPVACLTSVAVSLTTGSSWSTAATVGIALVGAGTAMGFSPGLVAGAVISGAYFGDKMSPFSETTNLASSMAGVDLFEHIHYMLYTTIPAMVISLIFYGVAGYTANRLEFDYTELVSVISIHFNVSWYVFLPAVITLVAILKKIPAIPAIVLGCFTGATGGLLFQYSNSDTFLNILSIAANGYQISSGNEMIDSLLSRGGMSSMLTTVWLIVSAMFYAGILHGTGMLASVSSAILKQVKTPKTLISMTLLTSTGANVIASEQYLSIVITGRIFKDSYEKFQLKGKNLSRALEDSGTLTSALIPWNTCGAFLSGALGVATVAYAPFALLNYITPIISLIYAWSGISVAKYSEGEPDIEDSSALD